MRTSSELLLDMLDEKSATLAPTCDGEILPISSDVLTPKHTMHPACTDSTYLSPFAILKVQEAQMSGRRSPAHECFERSSPVPTQSESLWLGRQCAEVVEHRDPVYPHARG